MQLRIWLDLTSEQRRSRLLEGLDSWVKLGLLSEDQILDIARKMSEPVAAATEPGLVETALPAFDSPAPVAVNIIPALPEPAPPAASRLTRALRSLLEEISVIWLLFLGVFLVVVSSGVLAASQWASFSAVGQYAVLLAYTLVFWGASVWAQRQERLQATARMLALATLLLIPINFWMIDALGVLSGPLGGVVGGLSAVLLSCLPVKLLAHRSNQLNLVGLCWLQIGWLGSWSLWPVAATYLGTVGTAANLTYQDRPAAIAAAAPEEAAGRWRSLPRESRVLSFDVLAVALSVLILLFRSLFVAQVLPHQLGLAAGICGWLLAWIARSQASQRLWARLGFGLLLLGWAVSVGYQPPWQAIGVSGLALWLIGERLKAYWQKAYLFTLIGVAGQAYWLFGVAIPASIKEPVLTRLSGWLSAQPVSSSEWLSLGFFPFLLGLLVFAVLLHRWQQAALAKQTEWVALGLGVVLVLLGRSNRFTAAAILLLLTATLAFVLSRRSSKALVGLTHGTGLLALAATVNYFLPTLSTEAWAYGVLGVAIAQILLHLALRNQHWPLILWQAGLAVLALSYGLLTTVIPNTQPNWIWLTALIALTIVANHRQALQPLIAAKATLVAALLYVPWMTGWPNVTVGFAAGALCMGLNSRLWRSQWATLFTVGAGLAAVISSLWHFSGERSGWLLIVGALAVWAMWLLQRTLARQAGGLANLYRQAAQVWGGVLLLVLLLWGSLIGLLSLPASSYLVGAADYVSYVLAAVVLLIAALLESIRYRLAEWRYWSLAWAVEIFAVLALWLSGLAVAQVAVTTLALGLLTQVGSDLWALRRPPYRASWHGIPIAYAALGTLLGHVQFDGNSGLYTLFAGAISLGIGRRKPALNPLSYLGLMACSVGAYELLIYRLLQASGGEAGDGLTLLAALGLVIALAQRFLSPWLLRYMRLPSAGLFAAAHAHWAFGSGLAVFAALEGLSQPRGIALWTLVTGLLAAYALSIGNRRWTPQTFASTHTVWTSLGILEVMFCAAYDRFVWFYDRTLLLSWGGVIACAVALAIYQAPWQRWGWPLQPWRWLGLGLPLSALAVALNYKIPTQTLLIVGAFYAGMGKQYDRIRLSYLSVLLFDWALLRYLAEQGWLTGLAFSLVAGLSVLYVAEVEPYFNDVSQKQQRHWLRILASGLIGVTALYQAERYDPMLAYAALTLALCTGLIFAGLGLKVRAFLYAGTSVFILQIVRVLWLFINDNSLLLWAVGIVLGLAFIWVAATFESRRSQITGQFESWTLALASWD
ncbi:MAG: hypothetical protein WBB01_13845 [Phormidesmis sp.]